MIEIYTCIAAQHDIPLVILAAVVCAFGCYTTVSLLSRAQLSAAGGSGNGAGGIDWRWLIAASAVAGATVWSTHFVAMLAYRSGLSFGYATDLTLLSIAIAIVLTTLGFVIAICYRRPLLGGAIFGAAVGAMHFTGMAAVHAPATLHWNPTYVVASLATGMLLGALALRSFARGGRRHRQIVSTNLMVLAIAGLHFTAMTALSVTPDPWVVMPDVPGIPPEWMAGGITMVMAMIVMLGMIAAIVDHRLAARAEQEAVRLRAHVVELERTERELQATAANLTKALDAAAAASQAKSQFLTTMSHELRTPLNAIIGFSELLRSEIYGPLGDARYKGYIDDVLNSGKHLLSLVNDVLDFSKIDAGALELNEDHVNLDELLTRTLRMMEGQAAQVGIDLGHEIARELPMLRCDERRVRQILLNLLSNAVKFTPRNGKVRLICVAAEDGVAIQVIDTGIGIAPDKIPVALERFGQVDSSLERKYEGTGLGLPLSKKLVELHGGRLRLESQVGIGTKVTVLFPGDRCIARSAAA